MKPYELKNYGKPFPEMNKTVPIEVFQAHQKNTQRIIKKHLGFFQRIKLGRTMRKERKRFMYLDLFDIKDKGLRDERFLMMLVGRTHFFFAIAQVAGKEKAIEIDKELQTSLNSARYPHMLPSAEDLLQFENPFAALKDWLIALWKEAKQKGIAHYEVVQDSDTFLQINCTYCAYDQIARKVDMPEATSSLCQSEDMLFSFWCDALGLKYSRTCALAKGDKYCDFRLEYHGKK